MARTEFSISIQDNNFLSLVWSIESCYHFIGGSIGVSSQISEILWLFNFSTARWWVSVNRRITIPLICLFYANIFWGSKYVMGFRIESFRDTSYPIRSFSWDASASLNLRLFNLLCFPWCGESFNRSIIEAILLSREHVWKKSEKRKIDKFLIDFLFSWRTRLYRKA